MTVRFVRVTDGQVFWTAEFRRNFPDIFSVQDRVSEKVVGLLAVRMAEQEQVLLTKRYTDNPHFNQVDALRTSGTSSSRR